MPKASIIIRTFNEEKHLGNLLRALEKQEYTNYEIIIVDSGSTDKTLETASNYDVKIIKIESRDFTFGYALNVGCAASTGEYLVFVSAHVLPTNSSWLTNLLAPFANPQIALVYGRQMGTVESKFSEQMDFLRIFGTTARNASVPVYYANNANAAIRKKVWEQKQFDEYLFGLEDIDWGRHVVSTGHMVHYEPQAAIFHIHHERWSQVFNRYRREAIAAVRIGLRMPPQARLEFWWFFIRIISDFIHSFPKYTFDRLEEIIRFRYYQWKGSRVGWKQGVSLDFETAKHALFFPRENQSVVIQGKEKAEYIDTVLSEMKPGDILVKIEYVGVCRTDIEVFEGTLGYYRDGLAEYPIVPGHEWTGTIAKIGSNNKFQERFKVGERVVGECILSRGEVQERKEVGVINVNGAYSKYIVVPGDTLHKVPAHLDAKIATLAEPLAVALRALRRIESRLHPESIIAVIGAGQIGNFCAQVLTYRGYTVRLYDKDKGRLDLLMHPKLTTYTALDDLEECSVIIEATGIQSVLESVLKVSRVDITLLLLGFPYGESKYNFEDIVGNEKVVLGSVGADAVDFDDALTLLPHLQMKPYTEKILPLKAFKEAWKLHKTGKYLKILLQP